MSILVDHQIRSLCIPPPGMGHIIDYWSIPHPHPMLDPFSEGISGDGVISYGLTSAGYDLRLAEEILAFKNTYGYSVNPKRFGDPEYRKRVSEPLEVRESEYGKKYGRFVTLPPNSCVLGRSHEYIRIPRTLKGHCLGKSTYARVHAFPFITPLEPGWEGYLTIEISNIGGNPVDIFVMEGIAQLELHTLSGFVEKDYEQKGGKYQRQMGVTPAKVL